jgi:hypothetical protein
MLRSVDSSELGFVLSEAEILVRQKLEAVTAEQKRLEHLLAEILKLDRQDPRFGPSGPVFFALAGAAGAGQGGADDAK